MDQRPEGKNVRVFHTQHCVAPRCSPTLRPVENLSRHILLTTYKHRNISPVAVTANLGNV